MSETASCARSAPLKLSQLQNFCKRDPAGYKDDYDAQSRRLTSLVGILLLSPNADPSPSLVELIQFMAAVSSSSYKGEESDRVAALLMELLVGTSNSASSSATSAANESAATIPLLQSTLPLAALQLHRDIRKACVSALILMRNKGAVPPLRLLQSFFQLMAVVPDKNLRESLYHHIVNDIRNINKNGKKDEKLNRTIQSFFHRIVAASANESTAGAEDSPTDYAAKRAVQMICDLYRRNVWNDERSVHILATAAASPNASVASRALRFFLNIEEAMALDKQNSETNEWEGIDNINLHLHSKKTKGKQRLIEKQIRNRKKKQNAREHGIIANREDKGVEASKKLFPAIELLHDPQGLVETILKRVKSSGSNTYKFEVKMLMLNFVTRVVGNHELILLPLYPLLQRYMGGHQRDVTAILAYSVQSCHQYVPPEEIYGILKTIAHNFITERCSEEQMAVGINAVRSICARVPSVLSTEEDETDGDGREISSSWDVEAFTRDLAGYAKHKDRSISIAGRGWVNFIREVHPSLLQGKDRGLVGAGLHKAGERPLRYGEVRAALGVEGADLLAAYEASKKRKEKGGKKNSVGSDSEGDDDSESGWVEMNDGEEGGDDESESGWVEMNDEEDESDEEAPDLVLLGDDEEGKEEEDVDGEKGDTVDYSKLSKKERAKMQQEVSSTRIFTASEFAKMHKLVARQQQARRDPRLAAKLKRAIAKGEEFDDISDSDSDDSDDEDIHIKGAVNNTDIMADAKRKRMSKAEKLEKIIEGRVKFETNERAGGSTNTEKKRKKNFAMSKYSFDARKKVGEKTTAKMGRKQERSKLDGGGRDAKKRRRKF
ncbi:SDA1 family protein [Skeletonema marinoi]|uniref:Protein SDA1 n=2 Tax=Skeletonema marinoi TaxID=267567 RepID=A0AAD8YIS6_9STRA|nr:SDA1 family protein [Skeletonema marinoi]